MCQQFVHDGKPVGRSREQETHFAGKAVDKSLVDKLAAVRNGGTRRNAVNQGSILSPGKKVLGGGFAKVAGGLTHQKPFGRVIPSADRRLLSKLKSTNCTAWIS